LDIFAFVVTPRIIFELVLVTIAAVLVINWRRVLGYLRMLSYPYRLSNLRYTWKKRKVKLIERSANLLLMFGFLSLSILLVSVILDILWFASGAWLILINIMLVGIGLRILGIILERPDRVSAMYTEVASNRLGLAGLIVVAIFAGIAVFGDIIAPYDPEMIGAGPAFGRPTPLPQALASTLGISLIILLVGSLLWLYSNRTRVSSIPSFIRRTGYGILLAETGAVLLLAALGEGVLMSIAAAVVLLTVGAVFSIREILRARNMERPSIRKMVPRFASFTLLFIGGSMLIFFLYQLITYQPLNFLDFHLLGTDQLGHDLYSGIIIGTRITLVIGVLATIISVTIGTSVGLFAGYYGGRVDSLLMRITDMFFVIPSFVLMIIVAAVVGPSLTTMLIVIGIFSWATTARIVRGQVLSIKERGYIERVRAVGGGNFYIMTRHVLPAVVPLIIVQTVLLVMNSIFFEISLDFVGLGDPAIVSWGSLLFLAYNQGISLGMDWLVMAPGYAIIIFLVGVSFLGFGLDEVTNPRLRRR
jgi:ABC-type dipeptide/oligopeptide/nickel transport system permease subunit